MKKVLFITDTWKDLNTNGIVTWLINTKKELEALDIKVAIIHPSQFMNVSLPTYPEIKMALSARAHMADMIQKENPDYIHIVTEGSLGFVARLACVKNGWNFTTFYHTRLPEYVSVRFKLLGQPAAKYIKWFHKASSRVMVSTESLKQELEQKGFQHVVVSPMGVDLDLFHKNSEAKMPETLSRPLFAFMGRIAPEKNIEDFLECDLPGSKLIIGDGPERESLQKKYSHKALFVGQKNGQELIDLLSIPDVFVFPSKTDTFSLAIIEALACGLPAAAYNVQGPKNILTSGYDGFLGPDLKENALKCLNIDRTNCVQTAKKYSWKHSTGQFVSHLITLG